MACNYYAIDDETQTIKNQESCIGIIGIDEGFRCCYVYYVDDEENKIERCHAIYWDNEGVGFGKYFEAVMDYTNINIQCNSNKDMINMMLLIIGIILIFV